MQAIRGKELQVLGRVLQHLMIGDTRVDLSALPAEWAEAIRKYGEHKSTITF
jgi:hypothetical protein